MRLTSSDKKRLVANIIARSSAKPHAKPVAIFAAGIPGAGKTEFLDRLFENDKDFVRIDLDEIVKLFPGYSPAKYYQFRGQANIILDEVFRYCRKKGLNFVLDGTFGHKYAVENINKSLKDCSVVIFYVWKEPTASWQLTKDREVVTKRAIEKDGFIQACVNIPKNLRTVRKLYGDSVTFIALKKESDGHNFAIIRDIHEIDELLAQTYTKDKLEKVIR